MKLHIFTLINSVVKKRFDQNQATKLLIKEMTFVSRRDRKVITNSVKLHIFTLINSVVKKRFDHNQATKLLIKEMTFVSRRDHKEISFL